MKFFSLTLIFILSGLGLSAQNYDTNYYRKYSDRLVVGLYQSYRNYDMTFKQLSQPADSGRSALDYIADANAITGLSVAYDKFSFSLGFRSVPPQDAANKGKTSYRNFGFSFGGNEWILETAYRSYKSFYDKNTASYDTTYKKTGKYYQNPSMLNESVKAKFMYFTNYDRFSYKAAYVASYRQMKSSFSWVYVGNILYNKLSTDSSFAPPPVRKYYGSYSDLNAINYFGVSGGAGGTFTLVLWKRLYVNALLTGSIEPQWRYYGHFSGESAYRTYLSFAGDFRGSLGWNGKNFYMLVSSVNDYSLINSGQLQVTNKFVSGSFTFGYRFKVKTPGFYKKFQETKVYKLFK
ncbi:MAG: DUF4421 family protein [Bacteroidia bacterium]